MSENQKLNFNFEVQEPKQKNNIVVFFLKSNDYINKNGFVSNYNLLLKNSSSYSNNSANFQENADYNLFGIFIIKMVYFDKY